MSTPGKAKRLVATEDHSQEILTQFIADLMDRYRADLEMMCEIALQGGKHGVLVRWDDATHYTIRVHSDVPYGHIHEHLSDRQYR